MVNVYLVETPAGLVLIDTGFPGAADSIVDAGRHIGGGTSPITQIILTHAHPDHVGGLAELVRRTGAKTWMHAEDAPLVERAEFRPVYPSAGLVPHLFHFVLRLLPTQTEPAKIDHRIQSGDVLPFIGLQAIHAPGHCRGQITLLWPERKILFAADACMNVRQLRAPMVNEDETLARSSLARLASLDFDIACFGHGKPIVGHAGDRFRDKFG